MDKSYKREKDTTNPLEEEEKEKIKKKKSKEQEDEEMLILNIVQLNLINQLFFND